MTWKQRHPGGLHATPPAISHEPLTILAEIITKEFLGTFSFVIIFVIITKIIPPEDFLCNVAATGVSLLARKQAKEFALQSDSFVIFTKLIAPKHFLCKEFFCNNFGRDGTLLKTLCLKPLWDSSLLLSREHATSRICKQMHL